MFVSCALGSEGEGGAEGGGGKGGGGDDCAKFSEICYPPAPFGPSEGGDGSTAYHNFHDVPLPAGPVLKI